MDEPQKSYEIPKPLVETIDAILNETAVGKDFSPSARLPFAAPTVENPTPDDITDKLRGYFRDRLLSMIQNIVSKNTGKSYQQWGSDDATLRTLRNDDFFLQAILERGSQEYTTLKSSGEMRKKLGKIRIRLLGWMNMEKVKMLQDKAGLKEELVLPARLRTPSARPKRAVLWEVKPVVSQPINITTTTNPDSGSENVAENEPELSAAEKQIKDLRAILMCLAEFCRDHPLQADSPDGFLKSIYQTNAMPDPSTLAFYTDADKIINALINRSVLWMSRKSIRNLKTGDDDAIDLLHVDVRRMKMLLENL